VGKRAERPLIGVTGPRRGGLAPRLFVHTAVRLAGGRIQQLAPGREERIEPLYGLVITGGHDIDPVLYAEAPEVKPRYDKERDAFESIMIEYALSHDLPLLGICRGAQLLNVRLGGSLFQELRNRRRHTSNRRTLLPLKTLLVTPHTRLFGLLGTAKTKINSLHNQGIDRLGAGLHVAARDLDDIVQAVEAPQRRFLLGVQWHPEFLLFSRCQRRLFKALVQAARERQAEASC
jgi:putative glutamine amidotransferase